MKTKRIGLSVSPEDAAPAMRGLTNLAGWLGIMGRGDRHPSVSAMIVKLGLLCEDQATAEDIAQRLDRFINKAG